MDQQFLEEDPKNWNSSCTIEQSKILILDEAINAYKKTEINFEIGEKLSENLLLS